MRGAVGLFLLAGLRCDSTDIPVVSGLDRIDLGLYANLTALLTRPLIVRGFFDAEVFADVCACKEDVSLFDGLELPYTPGNQKFEEWTHLGKGEEKRMNHINGGEFYRSRACKAKEDYVFYDAGNNNFFASTVSSYWSRLQSMLRIQETIGDPAFEGWMYEMMLGYSSVDYPLPSPSRSGSAPHRFPVLNFYYQICGKKMWHIGDHAASFGELDKGHWILNHSDMEAFTQHPMVYKGYTEPGDILLNPPNLWHFVQTAKGFNYAVTYKQMRYGLLADILKLDPVRAKDFWASIPGGLKNEEHQLSGLGPVLMVFSALLFGLQPGHPWYRPSAVPVSRADVLVTFVTSDHPYLVPVRRHVVGILCKLLGGTILALLFFLLGWRFGKASTATASVGKAVEKQKTK